MADSLFAALEAAQDHHGWKTVLDAGTGMHSLKWLLSIAEEKRIERIVAVTADEGHASQLRKVLKLRPCDEILVGNWTDSEFLAKQTFDVVIADYLIGAIDGFAPFFQEDIFKRLSVLLEPNVGQLHIIGMQPIFMSESNTNSSLYDLMVDVVRARDACILLAGHRCYREYPKDWAISQLERNGFDVTSDREMKISYTQWTVQRQINVARRKLTLFAREGLAKEMEKQLDELDDRAAKVFASQNRIAFGFDYIITASLRDVPDSV